MGFFYAPKIHCMKLAKKLLINESNNFKLNKLLFVHNVGLSSKLTLTCWGEILSHTRGTVCWIAEPLSRLEGQLWTLNESILSEKEIKLQLFMIRYMYIPYITCTYPIV